MWHTVILSKERVNQLYGPLGMAFGASTTGTYHEIIAWCDGNLSDTYTMDNTRVWRFKLLDDSVLFRLTWA